MVVLLAAVGTALSVSFLCSLLEASLLSVQPGELQARKQAGSAGAAALVELKEGRLDDAISAILTLNTIAHTVGAAVAGAQAARVFGDRWLGVFSAALTLAILVLTEIIPKTLGASHAGALAGFVGRTLKLLVWLLAPVLVLTRGLTGLLSPGARPQVSRLELAALVGLASRQGVLQGVASDIAHNALRMESIRVSDVMTPATVVVRVPADTTVRQLLHDERARPFSRIPVYAEDMDHLLGYVFQREVLATAAREDGFDRPVSEFLRKLLFLPENATVGEGLRQLLRRQQQLAIVVDEYGTTRGVLTVEDVLETILGTEILGEADRVADMRALAAQVREQRLERIQRAPRAQRGEPEEPPPGDR